MKIRKILLAAMALTLLAGAPVMAEEGRESHDMKAMKNDADTDGDGFLSKAEFMTVQEKRFAEMDANSDGKVSKDEMKAHFKNMKEKFMEKRKEHEEKMKDKKSEKSE